MLNQPRHVELKGDWLSQLLGLLNVTGRLEVRCGYAGAWRVAWAPSAAHEIPFHLVLSGRAVVEDADTGTSWNLESGDILLLPHGTAHVMHDGSQRPPLPTSERQGPLGVTVSENGGSGARLDMLCGRFLIGSPHHRWIRNHLPTNLTVRTTDGSDRRGVGFMSQRLGSLVDMMREELSADKLGASTIINALINALFALVLRVASQNSQAPSGLLALAGHQRLAPAMSAIFLDPARNWSLSDLAGLCSMSRATFTRHFQAAFGRTAIDFLTDVRMTLAANELKNSTQTTEAIAESVGYQSVSSFRRLFAQRIGMTAGQWRRLAQEEL